MPGRESPLGPISKRIKTDVRLPKVLAQQIEEMCELLGVNRNVFLTLAAAQFVVQIGRILPRVKKRRTLWKEIRKCFNDVADSLEETL